MEENNLAGSTAVTEADTMKKTSHLKPQHLKQTPALKNRIKIKRRRKKAPG